MSIPNLPLPPDSPKLDSFEFIEGLSGNLYTCYCDSVGGVNFQGDKLPDWEEFSKDPSKTLQANGWRAVAWKAIETLR